MGIQIKFLLLLIFIWLLVGHKQIIAKDDIPDDSNNGRTSFLLDSSNVYRNSRKMKKLPTTMENLSTQSNGFYSARMEKDETDEVVTRNKRRNIETLDTLKWKKEITFLQQQLIYDFAIKFKKIPRVSVLACNRNSRMPGGQFNRQQTPLTNIDAVGILKLLYHRQPNGNGSHFSQMPMSTATSGVGWMPSRKDILIKVVQINQLVVNEGVQGALKMDHTESKTMNYSLLSMSSRLELLLRSEDLRQLIVLDLSCGVFSRMVIEVASDKGLFNSSYHWLFIGDYSEDNTFNEVGSDDDFNSNSTIHTNNIESSSNEETDNDTSNMWFIEKFLNKVNININTELILAQWRSRIHHGRDFYALYDVWNPGFQYGGKVNISEIGNFSLENGLQISHWYTQATTIIRRMDMKKAPIRCLMVIINNNLKDSLEHYLNTPYDTHLDSMHRFNFALLSSVRDLFNFSFILSQTKTWGYPRNGTFDGLIGALVERQVDISGSPVFFYLERAKVIDYTAWTWTARPCFVFRHPRETNTNRIVFLQPLTNTVWVLVLFCAGVTIFLLSMLKTFENGNLPNPMKIEKKIENNDGNGNGLNGPIKKQTLGPTSSMKWKLKTARKNRKIVWHNFVKRKNKRCENNWCNMEILKQKLILLFDSIFFYIVSICQQGTSINTTSFSGRCIISITLIFSFLIYQFYSASIVGTSLIAKPILIKSIQDLTKCSLTIGIEDIPYNRDYFNRTTDPDAIEIYEKKMEKCDSYKDASQNTCSAEKNWYDIEGGVKKMQKGGFAFHVDLAAAYKIISDTFSEKEICDLVEIPLFPSQKTVHVVQKGSPLRKMITYGLRRIAETGLMDYQRKIWHSPKPRCVKNIHTEDLVVDMHTFASAVFVLIFGFAASLVFLALELMYHNLWKHFAI